MPQKPWISSSGAVIDGPYRYLQIFRLESPCDSIQGMKSRSFGCAAEPIMQTFIRNSSNGTLLPQELLCSDSLHILQTLEMSSFDFIATDPPYTIHFEQTMSHQRYAGPHNNRRTDYDMRSDERADLANLQSYEAYLDAMETVFSSCYCLLKPQKYMVVIVRNAYQNGEYMCKHVDLARRARATWLCPQRRDYLVPGRHPSTPLWLSLRLRPKYCPSIYRRPAKIWLTPFAENDKPGGNMEQEEASSHEVVYLIHFNRAYHHARHYLGTTCNLEERLRQHQAGYGARLMEVIAQAGITWQLARIWPGGRDLEKQLKAQHSGVRLCPICRAEHIADVLFDQLDVHEEVGLGLFGGEY